MTERNQRTGSKGHQGTAQGKCRSLKPAWNLETCVYNPAGVQRSTGQIFFFERDIGWRRWIRGWKEGLPLGIHQPDSVLLMDSALSSVCGLPEDKAGIEKPSFPTRLRKYFWQTFDDSSVSKEISRGRRQKNSAFDSFLDGSSLASGKNCQKRNLCRPN
jgi:hypothetical protein